MGVGGIWLMQLIEIDAIRPEAAETVFERPECTYAGAAPLRWSSTGHPEFRGDDDCVGGGAPTRARGIPRSSVPP